MTYLFVVIGLAVINSLSNKKTSYCELLFTNAFIFGATYFLESIFARSTDNGPKQNKQKLGSRDFVYDNLGLLRPENESGLIEDLKTRTGLNVERVVVKKIDLAKSTAAIVVRYKPVDGSTGSDSVT